ncbi:MAG: hypothetical protein H8E94_05000 [Alphaproteobacteria bacterium]|nr:hypothetical protein [Alphaproteobacteria bacterium]
MGDRARGMGGSTSATSLGVTNISVSQETTTTVRARSVHDTVDLSADGQKAINLSQGQDLAEEIRHAPTDENFAEKLQKAREDILRIGRLFFETLKASYFFRR